MSIQRWGINSITGAAHESEQGRWVKYADHVAAVEAAEQAVGSIFAAGLIRLPSYQQGYAAALDAARDAVAAVEMGGEHFWSVGFRDGITIALAAIDALRGGS